MKNCHKRLCGSCNYRLLKIKAATYLLLISSALVWFTSSQLMSDLGSGNFGNDNSKQISGNNVGTAFSAEMKEDIDSYDYRQPTSAPTLFFEAPSVPADAFEEYSAKEDNVEQPILEEPDFTPIDLPLPPQSHQEIPFQSPDRVEPLQPVEPSQTNQQVDLTNQYSGPRIESNTGAVDIKQEIEAENRTAINSATYIFYTFVLVIVFILVAYFYKK